MQAAVPDSGRLMAGRGGGGSGGLDPDRLDVEVFVQVLEPGFAPVAAHLVAAERHGGVHRLVAVDPYRAGADRLRQPMRLADVARPYAAAQAERRRIGACRSPRRCRRTESPTAPDRRFRPARSACRRAHPRTPSAARSSPWRGRPAVRRSPPDSARAPSCLPMLEIARHPVELLFARPAARSASAGSTPLPTRSAVAELPRPGRRTRHRCAARRTGAFRRCRSGRSWRTPPFRRRERRRRDRRRRRRYRAICRRARARRA